MSRTIHTEVFTYSELSPEAQERARDWYRQGQCDDTFWSEHVIGEFEELAAACGFAFESAPGRNAKAIYWEGFSHQGQGASFSASWRAERVRVAPLLAERPATYTHPTTGRYTENKENAELARLCTRFVALAAKDPDAYGSTTAGRGQWQTGNEYVPGDDCPDENDIRLGVFTDLCETLAHWLYQTLERSYEWQNADAQVAENIEANEYEFTEDGERA